MTRLLLTIVLSVMLAAAILAGPAAGAKKSTAKKAPVPAVSVSTTSNAPVVKGNGGGRMRI
jgi:hypothetical protein